ncbi:LDLR chaperone boca [Copidosoma floridanum]|uniref:LDLR chaperone boca n=1 Tax=Copidosoma floridanum TaxID=29053 RepID=UPI0006C9D7EC|nr:LDLR chaperone boca [Copidosoma floridanum]
MKLMWTFLYMSSLLCGISAFQEQPLKKRNVLDYTDADIEKLSEEWEKDDDPLEPDELPEYKRPPAKIDFSKLDMTDPDNVLKVSKKGKSVMMFVDVNPELSEFEAASVLSRWQSNLQNNHIVAERYPIDSKRAIFKFSDGAQAVDAKNFFITERECSHVTLEGQNYIGQHASASTVKKLEKMNPTGKVEKVKKDEKKHTEL